MTVRLFFAIAVVLLTCSCATGRYHDRDRENPAYYEGSGIAVTDTFSVGGGGNSGLEVPPKNRDSGSAVEALIESGISLAAYPDYYKPSTISGTCVIGEVPLEQVPCRHITIQLIDNKGTVIGATETNDSGLFAFWVKKKTVYFLKIKHARYSLVDQRSAPLMMGARVVLHAVAMSL